MNLRSCTHMAISYNNDKACTAYLKLVKSIQINKFIMNRGRDRAYDEFYFQLKIDVQSTNVTRRWPNKTAHRAKTTF